MAVALGFSLRLEDFLLRGVSAAVTMLTDPVEPNGVIVEDVPLGVVLPRGVLGFEDDVANADDGLARILAKKS
jgi:hypothetical protein